MGRFSSFRFDLPYVATECVDLCLIFRTAYQRAKLFYNGHKQEDFGDGSQKLGIDGKIWTLISSQRGVLTNLV
jgi:hypothetical protein